MSIRADILGALFASGLAVYLVYGPTSDRLSAADIGFSLSMAGMLARGLSDCLSFC